MMMEIAIVWIDPTTVSRILSGEDSAEDGEISRRNHEAAEEERAHPNHCYYATKHSEQQQEEDLWGLDCCLPPFLVDLLQLVVLS